MFSFISLPCTFYRASKICFNLLNSIQFFNLSCKIFIRKSICGSIIGWYIPYIILKYQIAFNFSRKSSWVAYMIKANLEVPNSITFIPYVILKYQICFSFSGKSSWVVNMIKVNLEVLNNTTFILIGTFFIVFFSIP